MAAEKTKTNPILEADKKALGLECEGCYSPSNNLLMSKEGFLFCIECIEAHLRRERFKKEDKHWL